MGDEKKTEFGQPAGTEQDLENLYSNEKGHAAIIMVFWIYYAVILAIIVISGMSYTKDFILNGIVSISPMGMKFLERAISSSSQTHRTTGIVLIIIDFLLCIAWMVGFYFMGEVDIDNRRFKSEFWEYDWSYKLTLIVFIVFLILNILVYFKIIYGKKKTVQN